MHRQTMSRRRFAAAAATVAAAVLAGCGAAAPKSAAQSTITLTVALPYTLGRLFPQLIADYAKQAPQVHLELPRSVLGVDTADVRMYAEGAGTLSTMAPLDAALAARNFRPGVLLPGTMRGLEVGGRTYGLPFQVRFFGWWIDSAAVDQAGLTAPTNLWTRAQFDALLNAALADVPKRFFAVIGNDPYTDRVVWGAFVHGFGTSLFANGRIRLTTPTVLAAFGYLRDVAARYWNLGQSSDPKIPSGWPLLSFGSDAQVDAFASGLLLPFPNLGNPVLPGQVAALVVSPTYPHVQEAVDFILWLYETPQQKLLLGRGAMPIVNSSGLWREWLSARGHLLAGDGGWLDPANFVDVTADWPPVAPAGLAGGEELWTPVAAALQAAVQNPSQLAYLMGVAEKKVNALLAGAGG